MKQLFSLIFLAFCPYLFSVNAWGQGFSLTGTVWDESSKFFIINAEIEIVELELTTHSDLNGEYLLGDLPAGDYTFRVSALGYESYVSESISISENMKQDFNLTRQKYMIFGQVINLKTGEAIPDVSLTINDYSKTTLTDANGYFELADLFNGIFAVTVLHPSFIGRSVSTLVNYDDSEVEIALHPLESLHETESERIYSCALQFHGPLSGWMPLFLLLLGLAILQRRLFVQKKK